MSRVIEARAGNPSPNRERGSALVLAILVVVILMLLGLAFLLGGETESKIARNQRDAVQAGFIAEGGVRAVKKWFDAPSGANAHLVPTKSQVDLSQRWVDPDGDGTYEPFASASQLAWRVTYRQPVGEELFEKPYRGSPSLIFAGTEANPDIRISESGSTGEQQFLNDPTNGLNPKLFPTFPTPNQKGRIRQIDVYGPPIVNISGQRVRYGMATIKVTADIYQYAGTSDETRIATRIVKAVLNETPYAPNAGLLQSCGSISAGGEFGAHWGNVTSSGLMNLNGNLDGKLDSSVPFYNRQRIITKDMDLDGVPTTGTALAPTADDTNGDGTLDFQNWILDPRDLEDPWLKFLGESNVTYGSSNQEIDLSNGYPGCNSPNCQPAPWFRPGPPNPMPYTLTQADDDHSNIFKFVSAGLCPDYPYQFWKDLAQSGTGNVYYFQYDTANPGQYKLFGRDPSLTFAQAADGKTGVLFFDTATNTVPIDANGDNTYDNLAPPISLSGSGIAVGGFVYVNADIGTSGSGNVATTKTLIPPGEPYVDANGNNRYDDDEWFVDLDYPSTPTGTYGKNGMYRNSDGGVQRQDPSFDGSVAYTGQEINLYGVLYTSGVFNVAGNWTFFGDVITHGGMVAQGNAGTPQFFFDERLIKDQWPPFDLDLPRTVISSWQTEM